MAFLEQLHQSMTLSEKEFARILPYFDPYLRPYIIAHYRSEKRTFLIIDGRTDTVCSLSFYNVHLELDASGPKPSAYVYGIYVAVKNTKEQQNLLKESIDGIHSEVRTYLDRCKVPQPFLLHIIPFI
jgi:hypothetical protein